MPQGEFLTAELPEDLDIQGDAAHLGRDGQAELRSVLVYALPIVDEVNRKGFM